MPQVCKTFFFSNQLQKFLSSWVKVYEMVLYFTLAHLKSLRVGARITLTYNCKFQFRLEKWQGLNSSPIVHIAPFILI